MSNTIQRVAVTPPSSWLTEIQDGLPAVTDRRSASVLFTELLPGPSPVFRGADPRTSRLTDRRRRFRLLLFGLLSHFDLLLHSARECRSHSTQFLQTGRQSIS